MFFGYNWVEMRRPAPSAPERKYQKMKISSIYSFFGAETFVKNHSHKINSGDKHLKQNKEIKPNLKYKEKYTKRE